MICALPTCSKVIDPARLQRYPNTKTCSPGCAKEARKAYKAQWMRLYLKKQADLHGHPRYQELCQLEATGRSLDAWMLRGKIIEEVEKAHQARRDQVAQGECLYFSPQR
ncbi:MAG: hypothetical protein OXH63_02575 [Gemmatimonadetes bacterium]|nr:hypothetical protein [Gemmatimonadota bacterium]